MTVFGRDMLWALKDAILANGNYDEIYSSNFDVDAEIRGRNYLNSEQQAQFLDMPGIQSFEFSWNVYAIVSKTQSYLNDNM